MGIDGVFLEVHDNPAKALSDGTNALPLDQFRPLIRKLQRLSALTREWAAPMSAKNRPKNKRQTAVPAKPIKTSLATAQARPAN